MQTKKQRLLQEGCSVAIVGTGPSVKTLTKTLPDHVIVIAVNSSILFLDRYDYFFTIDLSDRNVSYALQSLDRSQVVIASTKRPESLVRRSDDIQWITRLSSERHLDQNTDSESYWFNRWSCLEGFSEDKQSIHTGNSVYSALNFVYHHDPAKVAILGLDASSDASHGGGHTPNNLSHLNMLFSSSIDQLNKKSIQVVNGSINSNVTCFDRMTADEAIDFL